MRRGLLKSDDGFYDREASALIVMTRVENLYGDVDRAVRKLRVLWRCGHVFMRG